MEDSPSPPIQNPTLFLGLFLLMLAFFIMLNALAVEDKEKSAEVAENLAAQFGDAVVELPAEIATALRFHEEIESSFRAVLPLAEFVLIPKSNALQVTVPASSMFFTNEFRISLPAEELLDRISPTLSQQGIASTFQIEVIFDQPVDAPEEIQALNGKRAGAFARALVDRGVPPRRVSAGVDVGDTAQLRMYFIERPGDPQRITLEPPPR